MFLTYTGKSGRRTVKAVQRGALAIHPAEYENWVGDTTASGWNVSHVPTGLCICHCGSPWKARRALRTLNALGDWNVPIVVTPESIDTSAVDPVFLARAESVGRSFHEFN